MKAIMISLSPKESLKLLDGDLSILVRKDKKLDVAIQNLIKEQGKCEVYTYCTKKAPYGVVSIKWDNKHDILGKVVARFWCNKVEEILARKNTKWYHLADTVPMCDGDIYHICQKSCLSQDELHNYLKSKRGRAIHITNPKPFDKPKEISEFHWYRKQWVDCGTDCPPYVDEVKYTLTRAPQSGWCYAEI